MKSSTEISNPSIDPKAAAHAEDLDDRRERLFESTGHMGVMICSTHDELDRFEFPEPKAEKPRKAVPVDAVPAAAAPNPPTKVSEAKGVSSEEPSVAAIASGPLLPNECVAYVNYGIPVNRETMEALFSKGGVSELFHGDYKWKSHPSCAEVGKSPVDQVFRLEHFNRRILSGEAIAEMDKQGYRPATHLELIVWAKAYPEAQLQFYVVALGSSALGDVHQCVAMLVSRGSQRLLHGGWFVNTWRSASRFLFVRKASS